MVTGFEVPGVKVEVTVVHGSNSTPWSPATTTVPAVVPVVAVRLTETTVPALVTGIVPSRTSSTVR